MSIILVLHEYMVKIYFKKSFDSEKCSREGEMERMKIGINAKQGKVT